MYEISCGSFQNIQKLSNFRNLTKIPEIPGEKCNRMEILGKKFSKIPCEVLLVSRNIPINSVPFATENFRKFKLEFLVEFKSPWFRVSYIANNIRNPCFI